MARLCRAGDDLALVRKSIEEHTNPERLRVLKLAEEQERDLLQRRPKTLTPWKEESILD
jgi:hypothetical protein